MSLSVLLDHNRRTVRQFINEHDKSTIISIFPLALNERKPTLQPAFFKVPAGSTIKPSLAVIGSASWFRDVHPDEPLLEIPQTSAMVAESVIRDYVNGLLGYSRDVAEPGLFWLPGEVTAEKLKKDYQHIVDKYDKLQKTWYQDLIRQGDILWARTNGNPIAIPDLMRLAARELGIDRAWIRDFSHVEMVRCVACGNPRNPEFPVCQVCKAVADPEKAKKLGLQFAS